MVLVKRLVFVRKGGIEMAIEAFDDSTEPTSNPIQGTEEWESPGFEFPPFLRKPPPGSRARNEMSIGCINHRIEWLAARGLRPHPNVLERRAELIVLLALPEPS